MSGFYMTRLVRNAEENKLWKEAVKCIRRHYPDHPIIIIDDGSTFECEPVEGIQVIQSEFPGRGELLPYYYFDRDHPFDTAIMVHDGMFFQKRIDLDTDGCKFLWNFPPKAFDDESAVRGLIQKIDQKNEIEALYDSKNWCGCFGVSSIITHSALHKLQENYSIFNLLDHVKTRDDRMALERVFGLLCHSASIYAGTLFGNVLDFPKTGHFTTYDYLEGKLVKNKDLYPVVKVWNGR